MTKTALEDYPSTADVFRAVLLEVDLGGLGLGFDAIPAERLNTAILANEKIKALGWYVRVAPVPDAGRTELNFYPVADIEVFATTRATANRLLGRISTQLIAYARHVEINGAMYGIPPADETRGIGDVPYDDPDVRRSGATYQLSLSRR